MRFLKAGMDVDPSPKRTECTKMLMKTVHPELKAGLAASLREILNERISKAETMTDWLADELTDEQLWYGASDVIFLPELLQKLHNDCKAPQLRRYRTAMTAVCIKAGLQVEGYTDLLDYSQDETEVTIANRNWWLKRQASWQAED
jgi:ribonuclease D